MWTALVAAGIGPGDVERIRRLALGLGDYAGALSRRHDFGFPPSEVRKRVRHVTDHLQDMRRRWCGALRTSIDPRNPPESPGGEGDAPRSREKSIGRMAGVAMIAERFRRHTPSEDRDRAFAAEVLFERQQDILDDLVDHGDYTFEQARDLYRHCVPATTEPDFRAEEFRRGLLAVLRPRDHHLAGVLAAMTGALNGLLRASPNGRRVLPRLEWANAGLILGQSATVFQREPTLDLRRLKEVCSRFWAPDPGLTWHERLAVQIAWGLSLSLIDLCFADEPMNDDDLDAHGRAWGYLDAVVTRLEHVANIGKDLRGGIANVALLSMRESEALGRASLRGWSPALTASEYDTQFARTAELCRRGVACAEREGDGMFFPFLSLMIAVAMIGRNVGLIQPCLRHLSPAVRDAATKNVQRPAEPELPTRAPRQAAVSS